MFVLTSGSVYTCTWAGIRGRFEYACRCRLAVDCNANEDRPVCGTDSCTYPNPCLMLKHVCKTGTLVRMRSSGPCSVNPDYCPCIQFSTEPCHPTVYLNSCALKKLASHAQTLLQCSRYTIERLLRAYSRRYSQYSVEYARLHHALEVLDELDVAHFK